MEAVPPSDDAALRAMSRSFTERKGVLDDASPQSDRALTFDVVDPSDDDAIGAMTAYFAELAIRFADGFDPGDTLTADAAAMRLPTGSFLVARCADQVVACGGVQRHDPTTAEIKRMWVHPDWRGEGVGRRMLGRLESQIAALGYSRVVLDTNDTLTEAISMYERAGYRSIERYNDNPDAMRWFAKSLTVT